MHLSIGRITSRRERGDTIVEVLIAIAVVSLVLAGAYVTTNHSLQATRAAQERAVALKLAESQIERIKGLAVSDSASLFGGVTPFCISAATDKLVDAGDAACAVNESGVATMQEPIFHISIDRIGTNDFRLNETWYDVSGKTTDTLQLRYRLYD